MKTAIQIILGVAIVLLGYFLVESIMNPIRFNNERDVRYAKTIERLKDIRSAQLAFRSENGRFTGSFDTLIYFLKTDSFAVVRAIGSIPDSLVDIGVTEREALRLGIISRDTINLSVRDSLFARTYPIDSIRYVPFTDGAEFTMQAGVLKTGARVTIQVFEASVHNDILLHGLDRQLIVNFNEEREKITGFPGLKVGSLTEATNHAGNWE